MFATFAENQLKIIARLFVENSYGDNLFIEK